MTLSKRDSPKGKRVALFVTCMVDTLYPQTGLASVTILRKLGVDVYFPMDQTCCGQPGFNAGYRQEACTVASQALRVFKDADVIVTPSGSCAAMIRHEYPQLFADDPVLGPQAERMAANTWELTEFIVEGLNISNLDIQLPTPQTFAFHDSCHGLRLLGLGTAARTLISNIANATVMELNESDVCCGFGGFFAVKMAAVSGAMLQRKIDNIDICTADTILVGDVSCLAHMNAGLQKQGKPPQVRHIAEVLAEGIGERHAK